MTQRQITQRMAPAQSTAATSSTALYPATASRRRSGLVHIPPAPIPERFPEARHRSVDVLVAGMLVLAMSIYWFVTTPSGGAPVIATLW